MLSVDIGLPERGSHVELRRDAPEASAAATESFYYKGKLWSRVPAALNQAAKRAAWKSVSVEAITAW
jgi:hypothetical protein